MNDDENVYQALSQADDDGRWAYGTGFVDEMADVEESVPDGVDGADLAAYCLMLGDDALICAQRLIEWCTDAPELEEEVALANAETCTRWAATVTGSLHQLWMCLSAR